MKSYRTVCLQGGHRQVTDGDNMMVSDFGENYIYLFSKEILIYI